jgi:hypothetical protein
MLRCYRMPVTQTGRIFYCKQQGMRLGLSDGRSKTAFLDCFSLDFVVAQQSVTPQQSRIVSFATLRQRTTHLARHPHPNALPAPWRLQAHHHAVTKL